MLTSLQTNIGIQTEEIDLDSLTLAQRDDREDTLQHRLNPTRANDFEALQAELVEWRLREEIKIKSCIGSDTEKQGLVKELLAKEAHLIRRIDDLRNVATDKSKNEEIKRVLQLRVDNTNTIRA